MLDYGRVINRAQERVERRPNEDFFGDIDGPGGVSAKDQFQLFEGIGEKRAETLAERFDSISDFSKASRAQQAVPGVSEETAAVMGKEAAVRGIRRRDLANVIGPPTERTDILRAKTTGRYMERPPQPAPSSPGWRNQNGRYVGYEIADPGLRRRTDNGRMFRATGDTTLSYDAQQTMFGDPDAEMESQQPRREQSRESEYVREVGGEREYSQVIADEVPDITPPGLAPGDLTDEPEEPGEGEVMGRVPSTTAVPKDVQEGFAGGREGDMALREAEERRSTAVGTATAPEVEERGALSEGGQGRFLGLTQTRRFALNAGGEEQTVSVTPDDGDVRIERPIFEEREVRGGEETRQERVGADVWTMDFDGFEQSVEEGRFELADDDLSGIAAGGGFVRKAAGLPDPEGPALGGSDSPMTPMGDRLARGDD